MPSCRFAGGTYIHLPKTGGGWVYDRLVDLGLVTETLGDHVPVSDVPRPRGYVIGSIRHPWAFYRSWYAYQIMRGTEARWLPRFAKAAGSNDIDAVVRVMLAPGSFDVEGYESMFGSMYSYLVQRYYLERSEIAIDAAIVTERSNDGLLALLSFLGHDFTEDQRRMVANASPVRNSPTEFTLSDDTKERILSADSWIVDMFALDSGRSYVIPKG